MKLPNDPFILFSYLNTELRDTGMSLTEFCAENGCNEREIIEKLAESGFSYDEQQNRFR
ncbi:MAG: DUF4250 domain-containing protein [Oscillospiraceae bacterium]|nr:DUF4250 domain-containing protein [Oscillospiraceae bacterium]